MRIGIFFGGPSREREISFSGGKTAFEHLDKSLFEPVPIFVDSFGRFIRVATDVLYTNSIRDFFPTTYQQPEGYQVYAESLPELASQPIPEEIGTLLLPHEFGQHFDFAFLAMHGPDCEDGAIQGLLEWYRIPYSGPGLMGSSVGIDKILQNEMIALANGQQKKTAVLTHEVWQRQNRQDLYTQLKADLGMPIVVKAPHQGSSIGVAIVQQDEFGAFEKAINQCFFQLEVKAEEWSQLSENDKKEFAQRTANLNEGIGFPVVASELIIYHPAALIEYLDGRFAFGESTVLLSSQNAEDQVLLEAFVQGQEFSCGCIQLGNGQPLALPPTEVIKVEEVFDFNSKYKPGATRKRIPVATTYENNRKIQENIATVFGRLGMNVCARIDGFLTADGDVLLHDPNTIPGMSPTSLIFKQMAEIGLNVTQAITYFIRQSIRERIRTGKDTWGLRFLLEDLDGKIRTKAKRILPMKGILLRDNDTSYTQARLLFSRMCAEGIYQPLPVLKTSSSEYYQLPLPMMFKDYIEDVLQACGVERDAVLTETAREGQSLASWYGGAAEFEIKRLTSFDQLPEVEDWIMVN